MNHSNNVIVSDSEDSSDFEENMIDSEKTRENIQNIELLFENIKINPKDYDSYLALIDIIRDLGDIELLRQIRQNFRIQFPLSKGINFLI